MRVQSLAVVLLALTACQSESIKSDGGQSDAAVCQSKSFGSGTPSGHVLTGQVKVTNERESMTQTLAPRVEIYFPEGRVPDAPVRLVLRPDFEELGLSINYGTVTPELGFGPISVGTSVVFRTVTVSQRDPTSDIEVEINANIGPLGSDRFIGASGKGTLCPSDESVPEGEVVLVQPVVPPAISASWWTKTPLGKFPVSAALLADGQPVPGHFTVGESGFSYIMEGGLPPNAEIELQLDGLKDILGRPIKYTPKQRTLQTTNVVSDLAFFSYPSPGSVDIAGGDVMTQNDELMLGILNSYSSRGRSFFALIALGQPAEGKEVHVIARMKCYADHHSTTVMLVSATGATETFSPDCGGGITEFIITPPPGGPLWLAALNYSQGAQPQSAPLPPGDVLVVDRIWFE
jgi:hypothetical protein